jgi:SAM-dependent methyltransferase
MSKAIDWFDTKFYPGIGNNWDNVIFRDRIAAHVDQDTVVLDLGAGAGFVKQMDFRGVAGRVCGVDLDPRVLENPMLDEARIADAGRIPYPDDSFDVVFSANVFEHLTEPVEVLAEVARVLKPGGTFLVKTPNRRHYMPLIARMTPHRFHQFVSRLRGRPAADTFPTRYRSNTPARLHALANASGLRVDKIELIESRPEYMRISAPTYLFGLAYERAVNFTELLRLFRIVLIGIMKKTGNSTEALPAGRSGRGSEADANSERRTIRTS